MVMRIGLKAAVGIAVCEGIAGQVFEGPLYCAWTVRPAGSGTFLWAWGFVVDAPLDS